VSPASLPSDASPEAFAPESGATDLETLEHELALSERRLNEHLAARETTPRARAEEREEVLSSGDEDAPKAAPRDFAHPPAAESAPSKKDSTDRRGAAPAPAPASAAHGGSQSAAGSACELACRAFGSMRRSADRICSITGDGDARCTRARARVEEASERISRAECACRDE
jgi:hypothetical protein